LGANRSAKSKHCRKRSSNCKSPLTDPRHRKSPHPGDAVPIATAARKPWRRRGTDCRPLYSETFQTNRFRFDTNLIDQNKESEAEIYNKEIAEEAAAAQNQKKDQKKRDQDEKNK
jgi:hypothetical protein